MNKWWLLALALLPAQSFADCPEVVLSSEACVHWSAPTENTDGSALTNLAGFKIYFSMSPTLATGVSVLTINTPSQNHQMFRQLPRGTWYFAMTAFNTAGAESPRTGVVSKTIRFPAPTDGAIEAPTDGAIEPRNP